MGLPLLVSPSPHHRGSTPVEWPRSCRTTKGSLRRLLCIGDIVSISIFVSLAIIPPDPTFVVSGLMYMTTTHNILSSDRAES
jgi:hypothetical protein